jgi:hypothetical protein
MDDRREIVAQLRLSEVDLELPEGWVAEEIRWDGVDREIAYDPRRFQILRASSDSFDAELHALFGAYGWRRFGVDSEGAELWVRDLDQSGLARLDRLRSATADAAGVESAGRDALYVA